MNFPLFFKKRASDNTISYFDQSFRFSGLWHILVRDLGRSGQNMSWGTENREREQMIIFFFNSGVCFRGISKNYFMFFFPFYRNVGLQLGENKIDDGINPETVSLTLLVTHGAGLCSKITSLSNPLGITEVSRYIQQVHYVQFSQFY